MRATATTGYVIKLNEAVLGHNVEAKRRASYAPDGGCSADRRSRGRGTGSGRFH
jgi:hypothetical protein